MEYRTETLRMLQQHELYILDVVAKICRDNQIEWFLEGGTALGAIRHEGFIPWDDDVDIGMPRQDYERFLEIAPASLPSAMRLDDPRKKDCMATTFAKICLVDSSFSTRETLDSGYDQGIFIDIFPYDRIAEGDKAKRKQLNLAARAVRGKYLYFSSSVSLPHSGIIRKAEEIGCKLAHLLLRGCCSSRWLNACFDRAVEMGYEDSCLVVRPGSEMTTLSYPYVSGLPYDDVFPCREVLFEGRRFPVPKSIDFYLSNLYGKRWMELPPEGERKNHAPLKLEFPKKEAEEPICS